MCSSQVSRSSGVPEYDLARLYCRSTRTSGMSSCSWWNGVVVNRGPMDMRTSNLDELLNVSNHYFGIFLSIIGCGLPVGASALPSFGQWPATLCGSSSSSLSPQMERSCSKRESEQLVLLCTCKLAEDYDCQADQHKCPVVVRLFYEPNWFPHTVKHEFICECLHRRPRFRCSRPARLTTREI